jgi:hypothetical protein
MTNNENHQKKRKRKWRTLGYVSLKNAARLNPSAVGSFPSQQVFGEFRVFQFAMNCPSFVSYFKPVPSVQIFDSIWRVACEFDAACPLLRE